VSDYNGIKMGGATFPLTSSTTNELLRDADPSIYYMLDFLKSMLNYHLSARIKAEATRAGIKNISAAVAEAIPMDPGPFLTQEQLKFPLLAIYRVQDVDTEHTNFWVRADCDVNIHYAMPPITAGHMRIVGPILTAVRSIVLAYIEQGFHPSYTPPGKAIGTSAWEASGLMSIGLKSSKFGWSQLSDKLFFPAWSGVVSLKEKSESTLTDFQNFAGTDLEIDLHDPSTNTDVTHFVDVATNLT
jgi:hypothetical protein